MSSIGTGVSGTFTLYPIGIIRQRFNSDLQIKSNHGTSNDLSNKLMIFCFQYDLSASQFSPDGRVFQIDYAAKAIEQSGTVIGLRGKNGVVLAVEKIVRSPLYEEDSGARIYSIDKHIGIVSATEFESCICNHFLGNISSYSIVPFPNRLWLVC